MVADRPLRPGIVRIAALILASAFSLFVNTAEGQSPAAQPTGRRAGADSAIGEELGIRNASERGDLSAAGTKRRVVPSDAWTYRPTVIVRRGTSQGSGTIIASVVGETLILTAAHVIKGHDPIFVELHRFNLGLERMTVNRGDWPRRVHATIAAVDRAADLAVLHIEKMKALPYVARLARGDNALGVGSTVTSIGIDLGTKLTSWTGRLVESVRFELNDSHDERPFLITDKIPEHGRSGGGLYLSNHELVGVCIGHSELVNRREMGVFASRESIRLLLEEHKLTGTIARSEKHMAQRGSRPSRTQITARAPARSVVTPTESVDEKQTGRAIP
jgi:S1-C subfamily serine protease